MLFHGLFHLLNFSEEKFLWAVGVPKLPSDDLSQVVSIINLRPDEHIKLVCSISAESYFNEQSSRHACMRHRGLELLLINDGGSWASPVQALSKQAAITRMCAYA